MAHRAAPSPLNPALQQSASSDGYDPKGKSKVAPGSDGDFLALDMGNGTNAAGGEQFLQMQLMDNQQNSYMQQRSTAIESIESPSASSARSFRSSHTWWPSSAKRCSASTTTSWTSSTT